MTGGYPPEFRSEAVRLANLAKGSGKTLGQVAKELGISSETLRRWRRQAEADTNQSATLTESEREELIRLRREVRILQEEREILKKRSPSIVVEAVNAATSPSWKLETRSLSE